MVFDLFNLLLREFIKLQHTERYRIVATLSRTMKLLRMFLLKLYSFLDTRFVKKVEAAWDKSYVFSCNFSTALTAPDIFFFNNLLITFQLLLLINHKGNSLIFFKVIELSKVETRLFIVKIIGFLILDIFRIYFITTFVQLIIMVTCLMFALKVWIGYIPVRLSYLFEFFDFRLALLWL